MADKITLTKRICVASDGYQFLTSGFPNRSKNKKTFDSVDGLFVKKPLLDDLQPLPDVLLVNGTIYDKRK